MMLKLTASILLPMQLQSLLEHKLDPKLQVISAKPRVGDSYAKETSITQFTSEDLQTPGMWQ